MGGINLAQGRNLYGVLVTTVMTLEFHNISGNSYITKRLASPENLSSLELIS
jgi:hypothetical protein